MNRGRRIRNLICLTVVMGLVFVLTGCSSYDNFRRTFLEDAQEDESVIYIGVYEPLSGSMANEGKQELKGIQLAHSIYSNVKGARVELVTMDTQSDTTASEAGIQNLIEIQPVAIIGSAGEANSMIAGPYIKEAKIPTITPSASNLLITEDNPYFFRACITEEQRGKGLAEYAYDELDSRKIAIVMIENDSAQESIRDGFRARIRKLHGNYSPIVLDTTIGIDETDMSEIVNKIRENEADVVLMPVGLERADLIFTEIENRGMTDITFIGNQAWDSNAVLQMMEKHPDIKVSFATDNVLQEDGSTENTVTTETQRFLIEYANYYGSVDTPTQNTVLGYDAYLLVINAINNAKSLDPEDIREALQNTDNLRCATGIFSFDDDGNPVRTVNISKIENGAIVSAYVTESTSEAGQMKSVEN